MNLLLLTSNYLGDDVPKGTTGVVHFFAREWIKQDHNVHVIHCNTVFPVFQYPILGLFYKLFSNKIGYEFGVKKLKDKSYVLEGVQVHRLNMLKPYPQSAFLEKSYKNQITKILDLLNQFDFNPDFIVGHWLTPQLRLLSDLKLLLKKPTCLVVHETYPILLQRDYKDTWRDYLNNIDVIGYRSVVIKNNFINAYNPRSKSNFICYSGIPEKYIDSSLPLKKKSSLKNITFVGSLISRKYPLEVLLAIQNVNNYDDWFFNIIGEGPLYNSILSYVKNNFLDNKVRLHGRLSRENILDSLINTDLFIMISKAETFGLVYIEAMSKGCIVIASRNEGMEGVIENNVNGFLCEAGNVIELTNTISKILLMSESELILIRERAILTAKELTDKKVSENYLKKLSSINN